jgi:hypothetical protein
MSFLLIRNNVDGIATRLQAAWCGVESPVEATDFSLLQNVQTNFGAHLASYSMGTGDKAPGVQS